MAAIGFVLSPLSWWNDLFVNLPLAYGAGVIAGTFQENWFLPGMIAGYWISNVAGLILMHLGVRFGWGRSDKPDKKTISRRDLVWDLVFSVGYTVLIVVLVKAGLLAFPELNIGGLSAHNK